ncbi:hypothetical protein AQUCO_02800125v1 [Aquilegia coerulea]|uniref:PHD-type domain-containing protein n=1 Tax=Aquilegia coerulea TaxID=218851 RepID=A0A2G5D3Z0_AQUCA|nr:hypothetical protein AQUCO_02800125v1 [Aquilegia coerulea]PIA38233.1 hypothetical protein AQUCO_02800125v1 [Aquilegia coerulea]
MMSIKEKWQLSQRKMEEAKKFALKSGIYTSPTVQAGLGAKTESHGAFAHSTQRFPPDRPSHIAVSTGAFQTTTSMVHGKEVQSTTRGQLSNPLEKDASSLSVPRTEAQHFRLDGRSNVSAHASQVRANSSGDHLPGKPPATSAQLQSGAVAKVGLPNKVPDQKVEGAPVIGVSQTAALDSRDRKSNHPVSQTVYGNLQAVQHPLQGLNFVQASAINTTHNEIAKSVQKFLHPRIPQHPNWTPPSTDYMNKSLTCQICKLSITDVESVLVCDACERGAHINCLKSFNQKGIPKGEWHCPNCLIQSNGKPLPPKYGRVTRNNPASNVPPNAAAVQAPGEKKAECLDQKNNIQKPTANGNPGSLHPSQAGPAVSFRIVAASDPKMLNSREVVAAKSPADKVKMGDGNISENKALLKNSGSVCALSSGKPNESANQQFQSRVCKAEEAFSDYKSLPKCEPAESCTDKSSETGIDRGNSSQDVVRPKSAEASSDRSNNTKRPDLIDTSKCKPGSDVRKDGQDAAQTVSVGNIGVGNGARDCVKSSLDGLHSVEWVGDILQVVDEKAYYKSCHITFQLIKSKSRMSYIKALWEDTKTGSKWAIVNSCYFPADLPEVVGRPCSPESNEVYESNHGSTVRAGLVQGTCEVLPPNKFKEESERRIHSDNGSQALFLCKWFYDESKGLFRPVTD